VEGAVIACAVHPSQPACNGSLLVELVGPAGVGKSTLAEALTDARSDIRGDLSLWGQPRLDLLACAIGLLPFAVLSLFSGRPVRPGELMQMIRLAALRRGIARAARAHPPVILLDEGPLFALAWLEVFYAREGDQRRTRWRDRMLDEWTGKLGGVVRLRARDAVLAERIRWRAKPHLVKDQTNPEIFGFTNRFRVAYDQVLDTVSARGVPILELRTDDGPIVERTARLDAVLVELRDGR